MSTLVIDQSITTTGTTLGKTRKSVTKWGWAFFAVFVSGVFFDKLPEAGGVALMGEALYWTAVLASAIATVVTFANWYSGITTILTLDPEHGWGHRIAYLLVTWSWALIMCFAMSNKRYSALVEEFGEDHIVTKPERLWVEWSLMAASSIGWFFCYEAMGML